MWEMAYVFDKRLKYVGNGVDMWEWLKYVGNDLNV